MLKYHCEYIPRVPVLVNEEHSEVVGESSKNGFVSFEEDISDSHSAVTQEAKLPLSVKLLQQDKTMVGQLHSSTCTKTHTRSNEFPVWKETRVYCDHKESS